MSIDDLDSLLTDRRKPCVKYLTEKYNLTPSGKGDLILKGYQRA